MSPRPRVMMVAFHFPPFSGSSGIHRSLKFTKYLPEFGWDPIVLSAHPRAFTDTSDQLLGEIPASVPVYRSMAFDAQRHFSWKGRYPDSLAVPDRFSSWVLSGIPVGLHMIRKYRPQAIWSTYPLASAHLLAGALARLSGLPWIADFRDPMTGKGGGSESRLERAYRWIENMAVHRSSLNVFVSDVTCKSYQERFNHIAQDRFAVVENGYDEEDFGFLESDLDFKARRAAPRAGNDITLLHTGGIYPDESPVHRGPGELFRALKQLRDEHHPGAERIRLKFRGSGLDDMVRREAAKHGISEQVDALPGVDYKTALREMAMADGLVILQGQYYSRQIPAKLYEYFRVGRPVIGLCGQDSSTATLMREGDGSYIASLADAADIKECLKRFLGRFDETRAPREVPRFVQIRSRRALTGQLAGLLGQVAKV